MLRPEAANAQDFLITVFVFLVLFGALAFALLRFGLVATASAVFYFNVLDAITLGTDWQAWYAPTGLATMAVALAVAGLTFWRSLGSRDLAVTSD